MNDERKTDISKNDCVWSFYWLSGWSFSPNLNRFVWSSSLMFRLPELHSSATLLFVGKLYFLQKAKYEIHTVKTFICVCEELNKSYIISRSVYCSFIGTGRVISIFIIYAFEVEFHKMKLSTVLIWKDHFLYISNQHFFSNFFPTNFFFTIYNESYLEI